MTSKRTNLNDQFVAFLEQPDIALGCERQTEPHFVNSVLLPEYVRSLRLDHLGRVFPFSIQHFGEIKQSLLTNDFVSKQGHIPHRHGRKVLFKLARYMSLRAMPLVEPCILNFGREDT